MTETWVPADACTLPSTERPLRQAAFDDVFAGLLLRVDRHLANRAVFWLQAEPGAAEVVEDLTARETACCSFFGFTLTREGDVLRLDVTVPTAQAAVLSALADRAERIGTGSRP